MKSKIFLIMLSLMAMATVLYAQQSPADSLKSIKQQKRILDVTERIQERKLKLIQLEKQLEEKTNAKEKAAEEAVESADENREAAVKLSNDAQDRKKAKKAERSSDEARRDAKRARQATNNLKELENDIMQLRKKIADDENTLAKLNASN